MPGKVAADSPQGKRVSARFALPAATMMRQFIPFPFWRKISLYHSRLGLRQASSWLLDWRRPKRSPVCPPVTLFISNLNTRYSLELALSTLIKTTSYPNLTLWVADNASTDGSLEFLEALRFPHPVRVTRSPIVVSHRAWLDHVAREVETPYWVAIDSDMLFTGRDWLSDMVTRLEDDATLHLLAAECKPSRFLVDPTTNQIVLHSKAISSWLFCVRTTLWRSLEAPTFEYEDVVDVEGQRVIRDTGARLLEQMEERGLKYAFMPRSFQRKYYHYGSLSWFYSSPDIEQERLKRYQRKDIERRVRSLVGRC